MENGFTFNGQHSLYDFGLIAIRAKKRTICASSDVVSYAISGMDGTLSYGDQRSADEYTETVNLYANHALSTQEAATRLWRQVVSWLMCGRRQLIWDSEPNKYVVAEVTGIVGEASGWVDEGLSVTIKVQPHLYSLRANTAQKTLEAAGTHLMSISIDGDMPAPISFEMMNSGTRRLDGCRINVSGAITEVAGLALATGETLMIDSSYPLDVSVKRADETREPVFSRCLHCELLRGVGATTIAITPLYDEAAQGTVGASVTVSAQGVWR